MGKRELNLAPQEIRQTLVQQRQPSPSLGGTGCVPTVNRPRTGKQPQQPFKKQRGGDVAGGQQQRNISSFFTAGGGIGGDT